MLSQKSKLESPNRSEKHICLAALEPLVLNLHAGCSCVCVMGQLGENWFCGVQLPVTPVALCSMESLSCNPQEGTASGALQSVPLHQAAPLLAPGERKGFEPHGVKLPPESRRGAAEPADFSQCWNSVLTVFYLAKVFSSKFKTCFVLGCRC